MAKKVERGDLKIVISGTVGSGRTTMCQLIAKTLSSNGMNNFTVTGEEENNEVAVEKSYARRLAALIFKNQENKMMVYIETKQMERTHWFS